MNIDSDFVLKLNKLVINLWFCLPPNEKVIIAGGCIRDMLFDKPISDIDVFYTGEIGVSKLSSYFEGANIKWTGCESYEGSLDSGYTLTHIITSKAFPVPIQLIKVEGDIKDHIMEFPCSNGYAYLEHGNLVIPIDVIKADASDEFHMFECSTKYKNKIKEKYNDFKIVEHL